MIKRMQIRMFGPVEIELLILFTFGFIIHVIYGLPGSVICN